MKAWDCYEFHKECQNPLYNYTDYTRLVYDYFCDYDKYQDVCRESLTIALAAGEKDGLQKKKFSGLATKEPRGLGSPLISWLLL